MGLVRFIKISATIAAFLYFWRGTCEVRLQQFGELHELAKDGLIDISYHHDRVSSDASFEHRNNGEADLHEQEIAPPQAVKIIEDQLKKDAGDMSDKIKTEAEYREENSIAQDDGDDELHLSTNLLEAFKEIVKAEFGDKTFCLILIFTMSWTSWNSPSPTDKIEIKKSDNSV